MALNLISSIVVFSLQMLINFFLTPFILKVLGDEAYGFLGLANSFVNYGYILTLVINSVAGRFVAYEYHRGNLLQASKYYSSVLAVNFIFCIFICVVCSAFILNLKEFINVSEALVDDVKLTMAFYFINFCLGLFNAVLTISAFVKNKLYMISVRNAVSTAIFAFVLVALFYIFKPMIYYTAVSALLASIFVFFSAIYITKKLQTGLKFRLKYFRLNLIKKLINSGTWNSFNMLSHTLINGIDLLLCNIFINAASMGILSVSKAAILIAESFIGTVGATFMPKFIELYSKQSINDLINEVKFCLKTLAFISISPVAVFAVLGSEFYALWLPFKTAYEISFIYNLSLIALIPVIFIAAMQPLLSLNTVTNKLKRPAIANLIMSFSVVTFQLIFIKDFGLYSIAICASAGYLARIILFDIPNAGVNLNQKMSLFYPVFLRNVLVFSIVLISVFLLKDFVEIKGWLSFVLAGTIFSLFGYIISLLIVFNKSEKLLLKRKILAIIYKFK
ncbi:polysaccharide biosynthesis protein [Campylobacter fetus subsp. testudinum]|uniref:Polysaccharide biosynthesis protein n=1 Tax=Campylobacter fetus subsp. testudinum TaxID=1507806 RepID=A0AAX0HCL7_CAMFE|nr:oligosaccharide flippase family protein [Campylobacter fetus]MPB71724.1 oligosaccharide flippase family protein [Campylobacter fetus]MPB77846.1 oligosaccharide flippase family protein [Campylobacter fetus]OCR86751.1 polysaccharide biosynthesis protein [Campylobacter fetus subsp. testudinum]OCR91390.1 polysaccharide biosynthesis protein [Campylobacter fetus subsp. testudinum]OCS04441.1 polysaccharide biosynthesis protein [Campylobacter fetus subsp. testudinum]